MTDNLQPLLVHLIELRTRIVRIAAVFLIGFIACFAFSEQLYDLMVAPLAHVLPNQKLITIGIASPFVLQIKIASMAAFMLTLPHTLYQMWGFIAPGLYTHEKKLILPLVCASTLLFMLGVGFAYFLVFGVVFKFIVSVVPASMQWLPDSGEYLDFAMGMFISFGVTFEVPILVIVLVRMGFISVAKLKEIRPYVIVGAFVIAAVVTPPDVVSQCLLAIPLWLLFEAGVLVAGWMYQPPQKTIESAQ
ncbi:twin-arginine translocase subunit TatC [Iodobacter sp. LRB]|uniref:Sec-independent protein translocase protein TatC n=2 Tax=Iodobacter TaxID=32014 RepID=A0A377SX69_9NEIS|nr:MULTISPECIES: twin-arginine translocase subunit TatC [Iodobacter]NHQ87461.1 twin-arginine translocase subunit TatC [Iodobacter violacea]PHV02716.1 twin-arginine translocase subunit TatC [Iodobacter sp. BJB302]TCU85646.1 Sec-independent protein translocase TatC [Iodobacter fluviatilis]STR44906.1 Sec-independent protein translocase protein TatC [Iodobacter fluviatilis]